MHACYDDFSSYSYSVGHSLVLIVEMLSVIQVVGKNYSPMEQSMHEGNLRAYS